MRSWTITKEELIEILKKMEEQDFDALEIEASWCTYTFDYLTFELWKDKHYVDTLLELD